MKYFSLNNFYHGNFDFLQHQTNTLRPIKLYRLAVKQQKLDSVLGLAECKFVSYRLLYLSPKKSRKFYLDKLQLQRNQWSLSPLQRQQLWFHET